MKIQAIIGILILMFCLGACTGKKPQAAAKPEGGNISYKDAEGLVELRIENGVASLSYELDRWEELHRLSAFTAERFPGIKLSKGPIAIEGLSGRVKDACIAKIGELDYLQYHDAEDFPVYGNLVMPALIFLMEDGGVEWALSNVLAPDYSIYIEGRLPFLSDIVSLSFAPDREGTRSKDTIYAADRNGLRYDMKLLCGLTGFFGTDWRSEWPGRNDEENNYAILRFSEDGEVLFGLGLYDEFVDWNYAGYLGTFEIALAENDPGGRRPGTISFHLSLDYTNRDNCPASNSGTYFISGDSLRGLILWFQSGQKLLDGYGTPVERFFFFSTHDDAVGYHPGENEIDYLLARVEKAQEFIYGLGMSTLVTGETEDLNGKGACHLVFLGTDLGDQFVREVSYAISDAGRIYEYDTLYDSWVSVY